MELTAGGRAQNLRLTGRIARPDLDGLCESALSLLGIGGSQVIVCDVGALQDPDAVAVDAIARLQLTARRLGRELRLENASAELLELLDLAGLGEVIPLSQD
jgi:ABC-type transporter Mla MlaB component